MRIVQLTPGTGNFYCGSCLRDNALVKALRALGHDVLMVPMYLPHVVDEDDAGGDSPMFYGGVNVFLQQKSALFRHTPRIVDRMFDSKRLLRWAAKKSGSAGGKDLGELVISMLQGEEGKQNKELSRMIRWLKGQGAVNVVVLSNVLLVGMARRIKQELGVPVVCMLQGEDLFVDSLEEPWRGESWDLLGKRVEDLNGMVAVSEYYGQEMGRRLGIEDDRIEVVHNGINLKGYEVRERNQGTPVLGYLARLCPEKGLGDLIGAYVKIRERGKVERLRLAVAGTATEVDKGFIAEQRALLDRAGLGSDVTIEVNVDHARKIEFLRELDVMSVPANYGESFGIYLLEAWAAGVPVVQPRSASYVELVEGTGGGVLVEAGSVNALVEGIEGMLLDAERGGRMGLAGRAAIENRFTIERMAERVVDVYERVLGRVLRENTVAEGRGNVAGEGLVDGARAEGA